MKIILSPAKNLKETTELKYTSLNQPAFMEQSSYLIKKLQKLSKKKIGDLMKISPALSDLNHSRYHSWENEANAKNAIPALEIFNGEVYRGLEAHTFSKTDLKSAQERLRILSGLYGILKPNDLVQAYRLEMGTRLEITSKIKGLYKYWDDKLTNALNEELKENEPVVNLASKEYFSVLDFKALKGPVITCLFKEFRDGKYKFIQTFGKQARGKMTQFIIKNKLNKVEDLKAFDLDNYKFAPKQSSENEFVFVR